MIHVGFEVEAKRKPLLRLINTLVSLNRDELRIHRLPWLYKSGVRYQREPKIKGRSEKWKTITRLIKDGFGDCEDLASARIAELREKKKIRVTPWLKRRGKTWHVLVRYPDGTFEDPSKILGMGAI